MDAEDQPIDEAKLRERELARIFEPIEGEMALIQASAKFNYAINKTPQKETEMILAYTEDTERLIEVLKKRVKLLQQATH